MEKTGMMKWIVKAKKKHMKRKMIPVLVHVVSCRVSSFVSLAVDLAAIVSSFSSLGADTSLGLNF
jgi:hypothetical protein